MIFFSVPSDFVAPLIPPFPSPSPPAALCTVHLLNCHAVHQSPVVTGDRREREREKESGQQTRIICRLVEERGFRCSANSISLSAAAGLPICLFACRGEILYSPQLHSRKMIKKLQFLSRLTSFKKLDPYHRAL
jgi:hypothetical protein